MPYSTSSFLSRPSLSRVLSSFSPEADNRLQLRADSQAESGIDISGSEMSTDPNGRHKTNFAAIQKIPKAKLSDRHRCSSCGAEQICQEEKLETQKEAERPYSVLTYQKYNGAPIPVLPVKKTEVERPASVATEESKSRNSALRKPKPKRSLSKGSRISGKSPTSSVSRKGMRPPNRSYHSEEDIQKGMNVR